MALQVKVENRLPTVTLNVALESPGESSSLVPVVVIQVEQGSSTIAKISVSPEDLGIPEDFDPSSYRYYEPQFDFSARIGDLIRAAVNTMLSPGQTLWLHLADPPGFLSLLPLEEMLRRFVGDRPIVRVPNFALSPAGPSGSVEIAVCTSEPGAKANFAGLSFLRNFLPALLDVAQPGAAVHLFTDVRTYHTIMDGADFPRLAADTRLLVHDPAGAPSPAGSGPDMSLSDSGAAVSSPWLLWILQELSGVTVDVVHFATHGYTSGGQSALAVAESPMINGDLVWARFVGPNQLAACLSRLGAWAVGFTSPDPNFSSMGLREIFDDMARLRPGPVLHHNAGLDPISAELARAYRSLLSGEQPERCSSVDMYAHPAMFALPPQLLGAESFADMLVNDNLGGHPPDRSDPAWVTSTRRYLEQSVARMFPEQGEAASSAQAAAGKGAEQALRLVSEVMGTQGSLS